MEATLVFNDLLCQSQDSVWVGDSPALDYLLRCGLVHRKHSGLSTDDIYSKKTLQTGISRLQVWLTK